MARSISSFVSASRPEPHTSPREGAPSPAPPRRVVRAPVLGLLLAVPGWTSPASAQVAEREQVPWYTEVGAFGEVDRDLDPLAQDTERLATGLGAEFRLGRPLTANLDADAGLRLGGAVRGAGYVLGADTGLRLHPDTLIAPYLGLRLGYTRIGGAFDDAEGATASEGRTIQDSLHLRPEVGLAVGRTDTLRVLFGLTLNYRVASRFRAEDADGVPLSREGSSVEASGVAGTVVRLAVAVEL